MSRLSESDVKNKLISQLPITIEGFGNISPPTVRDIFGMGEERHDSELAILLFDKKNIEESDQYGDATNYQIINSFTYYDESFKNSFFSGLCIFFGEEARQHESGMIYFGEVEEERFLTEEVFEDMQKVLKIANFIEDKKEPEYEAGNERAKKFMEKLKKKKAQVPQKQKINLHSLVSALAWKTHGLNYVLGLTNYQLRDGYHRLENIDNYHYTLTGIYTGNIDSKGIKLPDINWANIIK
jgi:hypothetical protein